ncbi:MAG: hypothetical protein MOGMAGMI_02324 [Candidatus Omnitrophica bacterium]|nr:hypothetical protein [Candidatus Omnitrophota bacterium]
MSVMFSATALGVFKNCPRCFWIDRKARIPRPRGIFPSLPGGMDLIIKEFMDTWRKFDRRPPQLIHQATTGMRLFPDQGKLNAYRDWKTGLRYNDPKGRFQVIGALDDLLIKTVNGVVFVVPFDYKTKGSEAPEGYIAKYYTDQTNLYGLLAAASGYKVADEAIYSVWSPRKVDKVFVHESGERHFVDFETQVVSIKMDVKAALDLVERAAACTESPTPPEPGMECEYCRYLMLRNSYKWPTGTPAPSPTSAPAKPF